VNAPVELHEARRRAAQRRAAGVAEDFDPTRLALARRRAALPRTRLGALVGVTPSAITQFEKGQARPTLAVLQQLADNLDVTIEFFRAGRALPNLPASGAHFRSLRSTTALQREQALAFGELALAVFAALEDHVQLPSVSLPEFDVPTELSAGDITLLAQHAREHLGVPQGPIPHVVRLLEAHGVIVVRLDDVSRHVDAFSHQQGHRPLVMLNPAKQDKARSRFDVAHELGHLLIHPDAEPGSRLVERQAHQFAAEFLAPAREIVEDLPHRLDWTTLHALKRRWGISLKALIMRAHTLGRITEGTYRRGMQQLAAEGVPERGSLGHPEAPVLLPRAIALMGSTEQQGLYTIANDAGLAVEEVERILQAAGGDTKRPVLSL
jgi:Zn-dependent peptidase ImmA (M78 family)/DNA-binding XRE family transcriptional regulator